ncbi:MAG TPA: hypothetical protein VIM70_04330 [Clostridium sp.]|uniref:hypothetical protein n=1 Tax=Clostridium sp. TaxID=1506 RepID=UPI002F927CD5
MNINKLHINQVIKNYRELCKILDIIATTGNAKKSQIKELFIFCNYHKEGNKFIIDEIYETPIVTIESLSTANKYIHILSNVIAEYLYNNPEVLDGIPINKLFNALGITNNNYIDSMYYRKELSQLYDIQLASIYYFYSDTRIEFKRIIERCLNNLQGRRVLNWHKCIMMKKDNTIVKADLETEKEIINMEKEALQFLEYRSMYELMQSRKDLKKFNIIVKKEAGFSYYYAYDLIIGDRALKIEYDNIQEEKKNVNNVFMDRAKVMFSKEKFNGFKSDYDILINLLMDIDIVDTKLESTLKSKREENKTLFKKEIKEQDKTYDRAVDKIRDKYHDTYYKDE